MEASKHVLARSTVLVVETVHRYSEMTIPLVVFLVFICHHMFQQPGSNSFHPDVNCARGHYLHCLPCPPGFFLHVDQRLHPISACRRCNEPRRDLHERSVRGCTPVSDTVVGCEGGYYLFSGESVCSKCSKCRRPGHIGRACNGTHDTVCCPVKGMTVVATVDGQEECVFMRAEYVTVGQDKVVKEKQSAVSKKPEVWLKWKQEKLLSRFSSLRRENKTKTMTI